MNIGLHLELRLGHSLVLFSCGKEGGRDKGGGGSDVPLLFV